MRKKAFILFFFIFVYHSESFEQNDYKFSLTHRLLFNDFKQKTSDANKSYGNLPRGMELSFSKRLDSTFKINIPIRIGFTKSPNDTTTFGRTFYGADIQGQIQYSKHRLIPYLTSGLSIYKRVNKTDLGIPFYMGLNFKVEEGFAFNIQSGYRWSFKSNASSWHHGIGIVFNLVKISPPKAILPILHNRQVEITEALDIIGWWQTPLLRHPKANVSLNFTIPSIMDSDLDDVPDNIDDCPTIKGLVNNRGCPPNPEISWLQDSNNIAFEFGQSSLTQNSFPFLDKVIQFLKEQPQIKISIQGHTDSQGSALFNQKLSEVRAKACLNYIVNKGVSATQLTYIGFGESQPIADNTTEMGRSLNRRATFIVTHD